MYQILLFLALSAADRIAQKWNARQMHEACTVEVEKVDEDKGQTGAPYSHTENCPDKPSSYRMPDAVPEGYYLNYEVPGGWMLRKAAQSDEQAAD